MGSGRAPQRASSGDCLVVALSLLMLPVTAGALPRPEPRLAAGWSVELGSQGRVRAMRASPPYDWLTGELAVGAEPRLRSRRGRLFAVSHAARSVTVIRTRDWSVLRTFDLGETGAPVDIAAVGRREAYLTIEGKPSLMRMDLDSGEVEEAADLGALVEQDAIADASGMLRSGDRLFIQIRQLDAEEGTPREPSYLGVYDTASRKLVDADPSVEGTQAIRLAGTFAKMKMQVLPSLRLLFVSASGGFFDAGGIEAIDLDSLESQGLVIAEENAQIGADVGAFAMLDRHRGYLVFSTDLLLSSHLLAFTDAGDVTLPGLRTLLDYFMPALVLVRRTGTLFAPDNGTAGQAGVLAFAAADGSLLTSEPTPTAAGPSDLEKIPGPPQR